MFVGSFSDVIYQYSGPIHQIPTQVLSPYNAQATLHFYDAFWALYLPITVPGRVSDIWRSYFSQTLFPKLGLKLGFLPRPLVTQDRNPHSITGDFEAELDLYLKSSALIEIINKIQNSLSFTNLPQAIEELYIEMYERGFIELEDVKHVQLWIEALINAGYDFPKFHHQNQQSKPLQEEESMSNDMINLAKLGTPLNEISLQKFNEDKKFECDVHNVKIGNSDLHDGCRGDIAAIMSHIGQNVIMLGLKTSKEFHNYPQIKKMPGVHVHRKISNVLHLYSGHTTSLRKEWVQENYNYYKNDTVVNNIQGFVCTFPAGMNMSLNY